MFIIYMIDLFGYITRLWTRCEDSLLSYFECAWCI